MSEMEQIGTVEILRQRVYNLDPENDDPNATSVVVEPCTFPLFSDGLSYLWIMRGKLNGRGVRRMGDGMFSMRQADTPTGPEVQFPSRTFGSDEWRVLVDNDPTCADGHPEQRLRVRETEAAEG